MANEQNLKPVRTKKEARERGKNGGIASGKARAERKTLREELLTLLAQDNYQERISLSLLMKATSGDTKAFEVIRDTIGEKPKENISVGVSYEDYIKKVEDKDEY